MIGNAGFWTRMPKPSVMVLDSGSSGISQEEAKAATSSTEEWW